MLCYMRRGVGGGRRKRYNQYKVGWEKAKRVLRNSGEKEEKTRGKEIIWKRVKGEQTTEGIEDPQS